MPDEKKAYGTSHGGELYTRLQATRRALRHASHVYAHTKNTPSNKPKYDAAVEQLEMAAQAFTLASAQYGMFSDCAAPANGPARDQWEKDTNPEPAR